MLRHHDQPVIGPRSKSTESPSKKGLIEHNKRQTKKLKIQTLPSEYPFGSKRKFPI